MRSISFFKTFALATLGLGILGASFAQQKPDKPTTPAAQPNSPYQGQKGQQAPQTPAPTPPAQPGQNGQSGQLPAGGDPLTAGKTALSQAMSQLNATKTLLNAPTLLTIGAINVKPVEVGSTVTFTAEVFDRLNPKLGYTFAMTGAPWGSYRPENGHLHMDSQPARDVQLLRLGDGQQRQHPPGVSTGDDHGQCPFANFGYDLFRSSRALLDARLFLLRTGGMPLIGPGQLGQQQYLSSLQLPQPNSQQNPMQQFMQQWGMLGGTQNNSRRQALSCLLSPRFQNRYSGWSGWQSA